MNLSFSPLSLAGCQPDVRHLNWATQAPLQSIDGFRENVHDRSGALYEHAGFVKRKAKQ